MFNNTTIAVILLISFGSCASSKSTNTATVAQSTTSVDSQSNTNKYKADLTKVPQKSSREILYDK